MKRTLAIIIVFVLLTACASVPTAMPTAVPTATHAVTATFTPTQLPTIAPTATLTATPRATNTPQPTNTPRPPTLRELADKTGFKIGTLLDPRIPERKAIEQREFNLGIVTFSWIDHVKPDGSINFTWTDRQVQEAKEASMRIRFQHLIFAHSYPDWLKEKTSSRSEFEKFMKSVIVQIMTRYKGVIHEYVVVNEPYSPPHMKNDIFWSVYGGYDYVDVVFQTARETDPAAILIFNDNYNHTADGWNTAVTRKIVEQLRSKNLIDGVGLQMHLLGTNLPNKQNVIDTMRSYGIPVYVTEFDVSLKSVSGTRDERYAKQGQIYKDALGMCLESKVCISFSVWGIRDKDSWLKNPKFADVQGASPDADPTMFDDEMNPKPAYFAIRDALIGK